MLLDTPDLACPMNGTLSRSTSSRERQRENLAFRHSLYIYGPNVSQNQRYALSPLFLPLSVTAVPLLLVLFAAEDHRQLEEKEAGLWVHGEPCFQQKNHARPSTGG